MSLACLFGRHRPSLTSIVIRPAGHAALCEGCGRPLVRAAGAKWQVAPPLDTPIAR